MTSAALTTAEKELLQNWIVDGALGYATIENPGAPTVRLKPLKASDLSAIAALDNDVVRGYLVTYQEQKIASLGNGITSTTTNITNAQTALADTVALKSTIAGITVLTVPTSA